jgi:hypothetical protein
LLGSFFIVALDALSFVDSIMGLNLRRNLISAQETVKKYMTTMFKEDNGGKNDIDNYRLVVD